MTFLLKNYRFLNINEGNNVVILIISINSSLQKEKRDRFLLFGKSSF